MKDNPQSLSPSSSSPRTAEKPQPFVPLASAARGCAGENDPRAPNAAGTAPPCKSLLLNSQAAHSAPPLAPPTQHALTPHAPHPPTPQIGTAVYFATTNVMYTHDGRGWQKRNVDRIGAAGGVGAGLRWLEGGTGVPHYLVARPHSITHSPLLPLTPDTHPAPTQTPHPDTPTAKRMFGPALRDVERWQQRLSADK